MYQKLCRRCQRKFRKIDMTGIKSMLNYSKSKSMLFLYMYIIDFLFEFMPTFAFSTTVHSSESVV